MDPVPWEFGSYNPVFHYGDKIFLEPRVGLQQLLDSVYNELGFLLQELARAVRGVAGFLSIAPRQAVVVPTRADGACAMGSFAVPLRTPVNNFE